MNNSTSIKEKLYQACNDNIDQRIKRLDERLESIKESIRNETKSSVGDKHETGRVMMQLEAENTKAQFASALEVKRGLASIDASTTFHTAQKGSLVITDRAKYYIAIGVGKVVIEGIVYYCISPQAPIAKALKGKQEGDEVSFNGRRMFLKEVH